MQVLKFQKMSFSSVRIHIYALICICVYMHSTNDFGLFSLSDSNLRFINLIIATRENEREDEGAQHVQSV